MVRQQKRSKTEPFKIALLALALCFLRLHGDRALAVPSSGKGIPGGKCLVLPPIGKAADETRHFFISLQGYDEKISNLFEGDHDVVFIRGGVATGKTTLAMHLAGKFPRKYVNVPFTDGGTEDAWKMRTIEAVEKATNAKIVRDSLAFGNALRQAYEGSLILIYDEAHTLFSSEDLCTSLFKNQKDYKPKVLLFSASGEWKRADGLTVATPMEITQKFMWAPTLPYTQELRDQLQDCGINLDKASIEFFIHFCGGHRGIFIAAMHWVQSKQQDGGAWDFAKTVQQVGTSYGNGDWLCADDEILGQLRESRAVRVNGGYEAQNTPREFVQILSEGSSVLPANIRKELTISGFVVPKLAEPKPGEFRKLDWKNERVEYGVANPLLAAYYLYTLKASCQLTIRFDSSRPQSCADLLMRALPYLSFSKVVSFGGALAQTDSLPAENHYNQAICNVLGEMDYQPFATEIARRGGGKPDITVHMDEVKFVMEGVKFASGMPQIQKHLERFTTKANYKATHKALYIIGNDADKMLKLLETLQNQSTTGDLQLIGLVPNIAHTAYTVHVKDKGIPNISTVNVECDLVARRLVLNNNGKTELYSTQSLLDIQLSKRALQTRTTASSITWVRQLLKRDKAGPTFNESLPALQIKEAVKNVDDLKKAVRKEKPSIACDADQILIYSKEDGEWQQLTDVAAAVAENEVSNPYGFVVPSPPAKATTPASAVTWVRQLVFDEDNDRYEIADAQAFLITDSVANVALLKKAIKQEEELKIPASQILIFSRDEDGEWQQEEEDAAVNRGATKSDSYGFVLPDAS